MKGILFSEQMFNAVIKGRKTQTRRIVKLQPPSKNIWNVKRGLVPDYFKFTDSFYIEKDIRIIPIYKVGETVYIKEQFFIDDDRIIYRYDKYVGDNIICKWGNPRTMAAKQARYFIEITGVRCERLQDISEHDAKLEGCNSINYYINLINDIHKRDIWKENPFVFVYSFILKK